MKTRELHLKEGLTIGRSTDHRQYNNLKYTEQETIDILTNTIGKRKQ